MIPDHVDKTFNIPFTRKTLRVQFDRYYRELRFSVGDRSVSFTFYEVHKCGNILYTEARKGGRVRWCPDCGIIAVSTMDEGDVSTVKRIPDEKRDAWMNQFERDQNG